MSVKKHIKPLKNLCNNYKADIVDGPFGSNMQRSDYIDKGIPVLKIQNIKPFQITIKKMDFVTESKFNELKRHSYKKGDIVMTKLGDPLGASAIVDDLDDGLIVADLVRIRAQKIDTRYLCYHLNSPVTNDFINTQQKGATRPRVQISVVRDLPIYAPPLSEQQHIVSILDEAFYTIARVKTNVAQNLKNARELFESYLQSIFEKKGDGWEEKTLGDVCTLYQGIAINAKTRHALVEKSDLPLLRIKDLKNNTVEQFIDPNNYPKNALVNESDIIYTRTGSLGLVFRGKRGVLHNNSFKVVPNSELTKDYLFIWLQNPIFKAKILSLALNAAQPDITHAIFKIQEIAVPPISEQQIIVKKLDALSAQTKKLEAIYQHKIAGLEELKKSLLQKAFNGELNLEPVPV